MAEGSICLFEQALGGCIVQVHTVFIGEHKLDNTQGIPWAWILPQLITTDLFSSDLIPIKTEGIQLIGIGLPAGKQTDMLGGEIVIVLSQVPQHLVAGYTGCNIPERMEFNIFYRVTENRCFVVPLPHNDPHFQLDMVVDHTL